MAGALSGVGARLAPALTRSYRSARATRSARVAD